MKDTIMNKDIPDDIKNAITQDVSNYSIGLFASSRDGSTAFPIGSGTLVRINETYAIITAHHVLSETSFKHSKFLGLSIAEYEHCYTIDKDVLDIKGPNYDINNEFGPDFSIIILPENNIGILKSKKLFYNIKPNINPENFGNPKYYCWLIVGCPSELTNKVKSNMFYDVTFDTVAICGFSGVSKIWKPEEYDLIDTLIVNDENYEGPDTFKGASGGGLWRVQLQLNNNDDLIYRRAEYAGIVFREMYKQNEPWRVRCHGPETVYRKLPEYLSKFN